MKKTYIIDTNVLIQSPNAIENFEDNEVVIPLVVVEELDCLKKAEGEKGANARAAVRLLERYRNEGNLLTGVQLGTEGILRIEKNYTHVELPEDLPEDKSDNRILKVCKGLKEDKKEHHVCLVTKDLILRLKAQIIGVHAEDYTTEQIQADEQGNVISVDLFENQFLILKSDTSVKKTLLGRVEGKKVVPLVYKKSRPYGISPRNAGQYFMQEALMTDAEKAPLVIIQGMAGTAKTFYSLAVGLEKVYNNPTNEYRRIIVCKPNAQFDNDIGFLPGDEKEKIAPLMRPIIDNLEQIIDSDEENRYANEEELSDKISEVFARGIIQTEALNYIRGRSLVKTYLIINEAQNMTPNQVKGIITRAGKDTKIILLGDPKQIDKPFLDERTNGLSYAAKCMKGSPYCWQITLSADECERSALAMDAVKRL